MPARAAGLAAAALALCTLALSALAISILTPSASAAPEGPPPALAALAVEGWEAHPARTGAVYFACRELMCGGRTAVLTVRPEAPVPGDLTVGQFLAVQEAENARKAAELKGGRSVVSPRSASRSGAVGVFTAWRDVVTSSGARIFFVEALLTGRQASFSVTSQAKSRLEAEMNFLAFQPHLEALLE